MTVASDNIQRRKAVVFPSNQKSLKQLGENIRLACRRRKYTQSLIAERTGLSRLTIRKIDPDLELYQGELGYWRRIVFNIAVSNIDDHLRNHGFIFCKNGWLLSPAYDINPVTPAKGLHLNINDSDNSLDYGLAMEVIDFFNLTRSEANEIKNEVIRSVSKWRDVANALGISRGEQEIMSPAFNI